MDDTDGGPNRCPHGKASHPGYPLSAVSLCARASLGVLPVQRLNAFVNAPTSWYPRSHAISEIAKSSSFKYSLARSALSSARIPTKVTPSAASRRASVRWLTPSRRAISVARAFPCGSTGAIAFSRSTRNVPPPPLRCERATSQHLINNFLRHGSALTTDIAFGRAGKYDLIRIGAKDGIAAQEPGELEIFPFAAMNEPDAAWQQVLTGQLPAQTNQ